MTSSVPLAYPSKLRYNSRTFVSYLLSKFVPSDASSIRSPARRSLFSWTSQYPRASLLRGEFWAHRRQRRIRRLEHSAIDHRRRVFPGTHPPRLLRLLRARRRLGRPFHLHHPIARHHHRDVPFPTVKGVPERVHTEDAAPRVEQGTAGFPRRHRGIVKRVRRRPDVRRMTREEGAPPSRPDVVVSPAGDRSDGAGPSHGMSERGDGFADVRNGIRERRPRRGRRRRRRTRARVVSVVGEGEEREI